MNNRDAMTQQPQHSPSRAEKQKVMAVVGSRLESKEMQVRTIEQTTKALNANWRIATGGADGTDTMAIRTAIQSGKADQLDIYLPKKIGNQSPTARQYLNEAKAAGANIVENAGGGGDVSYGKACFNRNSTIIDNSDAAVIVQNNDSGGSGDSFKKALARKIPIKKINFVGGIFKTVSKFGVAGASLGIIGMILDYEEMKEFIKKRNELFEKWKQGKATPADIKKLESMGLQLKTDAGDPVDADNITIDDDKTTYASDSMGRGNPYHDGAGKFCSEGSATVIVYG